MSFRPLWWLRVLAQPLRHGLTFGSLAPAQDRRRRTASSVARLIVTKTAHSAGGPGGAGPGTGRGRAGPGPRFTHPCTGGSSAAFSVILDMATETRDATPTRGEESARVGRNGLKIRPRARIREWATRRVRCTATRRVVFAWVRLLADTRKSPGLGVLQSSKFSCF